MPDSSAIDAALVTKLQNDPQLLAAMPNGVYVDEAFPLATRLVIVSLSDELDTQGFDGRAFESALYLVKAVAFYREGQPDAATAATAVQTAAARIDALLERGTLTVPGYALMAMHREQRIRQTEVDDADPENRWFHRGGLYRVILST